MNTGPAIAGKHTWKHEVDCSCFGGRSECQPVAGPYPDTCTMNHSGPYYYAHWTHPFGHRLIFRYKGRACIALCADRGPAAWTGRKLDLGQNVADYLGLPGTGDVEWDEVNSTDRLVSAMTPADKYLRFLNLVADNPDRADEYVWGAAGDQDRDGDGYPEVDCSGLRHAALKAAGYPDSRTTADGYMHRGHHIPQPSQIGDYALLLRADGSAHHIIMYVGEGKTVEAKGAAYGIVRDTVSHVTGKGGYWARDDKVNAFLGTVTPPAPQTHHRVWFVADADDPHAFEMTKYAQGLKCLVVSGRFHDAHKPGERVAWLTEAREDAAVAIVNRARSFGLPVSSRKVNAKTESMDAMLARIKAGTI